MTNYLQKTFGKFCMEFGIRNNKVKSFFEIKLENVLIEKRGNDNDKM